MGFVTSKHYMKIQFIESFVISRIKDLLQNKGFNFLSSRGVAEYVEICEKEIERKNEFKSLIKSEITKIKDEGIQVLEIEIVQTEKRLIVIPDKDRQINIEEFKKLSAAEKYVLLEKYDEEYSDIELASDVNIVNCISEGM